MHVALIDNDWSEHYVKRGDPKKPTYYIVRRNDYAAGLFSYFGTAREHIRYALSKGWLPVIDMQNYPNSYLAPEKLGKENSWEYYFEQPLRIGLEEAYAGENVILSYGSNLKQFADGEISFYENRNGVLTEWRMLVKLGLLKVKPNLMEEIIAIREKLFSAGDRVLGVLLRGTDYVANKPFGHYIPPPIEFAASTIWRKLMDWKCNKFFLATEDKNIVKVLKNTFGNYCVTFNREYVDYTPGKPVSLMRIDRDNDHFLQGKDYLTQIVLLSMCNSLVAAITCGTDGVMVLTENFEHTYFFNLGQYGVISML